MTNQKRKKNVIVLMNDTLRSDYLGCYNNQWIKTPNLDRLSDESIVFDRYYTGSYPTIPNRTDLFTGRYSFPTRGWQPLEDSDVIISELLSACDYTPVIIFDTPPLGADSYNFTRGFKGWHWVRGQHQDRYITDPNIPTPFPAKPYKLTHYGKTEGIKLYLRNRHHWKLERDFMGPKTILAAMDWLEQNYTTNGFFLWIDTWDPHEPFDPPNHYLRLYKDLDYIGERVIYPVYGRPDYMTEAEASFVKALYAGQVTMMDTWLGHLMDIIDRLGLTENTLFIFMSDHGHLFGEHQLQGKPGGQLGQLYEVSIKIPLIIKHPEGFGAGKRVEAIVQPSDIMPSILEFLGISIPSGLHGTSIWPLVSGESKMIHEYAFSGRFPRTAGVDVIFDGWAGPERPGGPISVTNYEWALICTPEEGRSELYDLSKDPEQKKNVIKSYPELVDKMLTSLIEFLEITGAEKNRIEPLRSFGSVKWPREVDPNFEVYVIRDDERGLVLGFETKRQAAECAAFGTNSPKIEKQTIKNLQNLFPKALVNLHNQYYWAQELL